MATNEKNTTSKPSPSNDNPFLDFLDGFVKFAKNFSTRATEIDQNQDLAKVIRFYGNSMTNVVTQVKGELGSMYRAMDQEQRLMADRQIRLSDGIPLLRSANQLVDRPGISSRRALGGIGGLIEVLKKIIRQVFDLFGGLPKFIERIFELIDNILKHILGLFSRRSAREAQINEEQVLRIRKLTKDLEEMPA